MQGCMFSMIRNPRRQDGKTKACFTIRTIHNHAFMGNILQRCEDKIKDSPQRTRIDLLLGFIGPVDLPVSFGGTGSNATSRTDILAGLFLVWERILPIVM